MNDGTFYYICTPVVNTVIIAGISVLISFELVCKMYL